MSRLFDAYLFVDWSASAKPTPVKPEKDDVWAGDLTHGAEGTETYCQTPAEATALVREILLGHHHAAPSPARGTSPCRNREPHVQ